MTSMSCNDVHAFLLSAANLPERPARALIEHIERCPDCRLRLFALFQLLGIDQAQDSGCERCREDLDAFVEEEQSDPERARRWYPHVWSHLWTCLDCLDLYEQLSLMAGDAELGSARLLPTRASVADAGGPLELIRLLRAAIQAALPQRLVPARLLYRESAQGYELWPESPAVWAVPQSDDSWSLTVILSAPQPGTIIATIDDYVVSASTDADGRASLPIPASYLTNPGRGDLQLALAPPAAGAF